MEPYLSKHRLKTRHKSIELGALDIDVWWNLIHVIMYKYVKVLFDEEKQMKQATKGTSMHI